MLIGGDVASDFNIYTYFIERLAYKNNCRNKKMKIVFILGNHELWSFPSKTIDEKYYRKKWNVFYSKRIIACRCR